MRSFLFSGCPSDLLLFLLSAFLYHVFCIAYGVILCCLGGLHLVLADTKPSDLLRGNSNISSATCEFHTHQLEYTGNINAFMPERFTKL